MDSQTEERPVEGIDAKENRWAAVVAALTVLVTLVPYLIGAVQANGRAFMWLSYNLDDSCVYLSWMRQAANGAWRAQDLFTTASQHGTVLNPLFLVLGKLAGLFHIPLIGMYQASRLGFGLLFLWVVWRLIGMTIRQPFARKLALLAVCFSSGLGWLPFWWSAPPIQTPIDKWQPEAISFLSLYLSPLFCFSLALQVAVIALLLHADRSRKMAPAIAAGVCGFVIGLVHSYDVISLAAVWIAYLAVSSAERAASGAHRFLQAAVAGLITIPAVYYMFQQFKSEAVFHARAQVPTLAPNLVWVVMGYGLTLALALYGGYMVTRKAKTVEAEEAPEWCLDRRASVLLVTWLLANIAVSYAPHLAFQRKMLQGSHIPLALLAGIGAAALARRIPLKVQWMPAVYTACVTLVLAITNIAFVARDLQNFAANTGPTKQQRPYLQPGELDALDWIAAHPPADAAIQPLPWVDKHTNEDGHTIVAAIDSSVACFTPGRIGRHVYCGHWGETPDFGPKLLEMARFAQPRTSDDERRQMLRSWKVRYLVFTQKAEEDPAADELAPMFRGRLAPPDYLTKVYSNNDADVYAVDPSVLK